MDDRISVYWWNLGKKTLDFKGEYSVFLKSKGISKRQITHPVVKTEKGFRFKISVSSQNATLDIFSQGEFASCNDAIVIFLTMLGDKALFIDGSGVEHKINWR